MGGSIRDAMRAISPKWLQGGVAEKFLYAFGLALDVLAEKANQAMRMHIPTYGDPSGLPTIGTDRLIPQGPNEAPANYAQRLKTAYDDWRIAGSSRSIMRQLYGYFSPLTPAIRVVGNGVGSSNPWDYYLAGATPTNPPIHYLASPANWDWDGSVGGSPTASLWWRNWVIIDCSSGSPFTAESTWGTSTWGDGGTWGSTATVAQVSAIQQLVKLWKPGNITCVNIILSFASAQLSPELPWGNVGMPDSNWGQWGKISSNVSVPARLSTAAYLDGVT